jgi:hypothetical protein
MTGQGRQTQLAPLGRLLEVGAIGALTDRELLDLFAARTDHEAEPAFSVLVGRHGATVLRTCRWHVNRPIAAEKFELPELPKGARVFDHGQLIDRAR